MAAKDKQKENLEKLTDHVEERQLDADRMAQVRWAEKRRVGLVDHRGKPQRSGPACLSCRHFALITTTP